MSEKNDQAALRSLHVNASKPVVNNTCTPPILPYLEGALKAAFDKQIETNINQIRHRYPLAEITVVFSGSSSLSETQRIYNTS